MRDHWLPIDIDNSSVVNTSKPQHHSLLLPIMRNIEVAIIPGPAYIVPDCGVDCNIVVAGWNRNINRIIKRCEGRIKPGLPKPSILIQLRRKLKVPDSIK